MLSKQNTIKAGDYYKINLSGSFSSATNTTINIKLTLNGMNLLLCSDIYSPPSNCPWRLKLDVLFNSLYNVVASSKFIYGDSDQAGTGFKLRNGSGVVVTPSIDNTLELSWTFGSLSSSNSSDVRIGSITKL